MWTAAEVMTADPPTCRERSPVLEAVLIFQAAECDAVAVLDDVGFPVGLLTDRDVALALATLGDDLAMAPVGAVATRNYVALGLDAPIASVVAALAEDGGRRVFVIEPLGRLRGMIGRDELTAARATAGLDPLK